MTRSRGLVEATPPAWRFTRTRPGVAHFARGGGGGCRRRLGAVTLKEFPVETIATFIVRHTFRHLFVLLDDIVDDAVNLVVADAHPPARVADCIVDALKACVTLRFHGIAAEGACCGCAVAAAHEDGICCVAEVAGSGVFATVWWVVVQTARWDGQAEASSCEVIARCFEGDDRQAKCQPEQTGDCTAERVTDYPDVAVGVKFCHVVVKVDGGAIVAGLVLECFD